MKWTAEAAYENWYICFTEGRYTAARKWWGLYRELVAR
jgi:hypothetical protein